MQPNPNPDKGCCDCIHIVSVVGWLTWCLANSFILCLNSLLDTCMSPFFCLCSIQEAMEHFNLAIKYDPDHANSYFNLGSRFG